jgi:glucose/arabinose dehydrogenase/mono/diheme cytochrome c family protein
MKKTLWILSMITISMLIITCTAIKTKESSSLDYVYPARTFNPNPSSEYLTPEESLKTFNLPPGYHLELVASEPMVKEPVAIAWDGNGRMFVAEMLTYMQDANASGEQTPVSRISMLEDLNNDGIMDKSTIFIDSLLLPRMILSVNDEIFVNETNSITITAYKDTNGDGKADSKRIVFEDPSYSANDANMEHQRSGLDWNLDNWMYMTYEPIRFRYSNGVLKADSIISGSAGQWGLTHDNYGRLFYSRAGGEIPIQRFQINPVYGALDFRDQYSPEFAAVWPIISTPDVQGGLLRLRPDSTLNHFTAAAGQSIFRGDALPDDLKGDYIVAEPVGRLIRRAKLINIKGKMIAQNAYYRQEFISSTDMNFRPVNTYTGPDGHLYIVDMHRGIIQQGNWTRPGSFLRNVIDRMGFDKNIGHGRIYRLVHDGYKSGPKPKMLNETPAQLVAHLSHPNGWWRDYAQKQLIVLGDKSIVPALKAILAGPDDSELSHLAKIHALWTLEGLDAIDENTLEMAFKDSHAQVRRAAVWISEPFIRKNNGKIMEGLKMLKSDPNYDVRTQLLLSLYVNRAISQPLINSIIDENKNNEMITATVASLEKTENIKNYGVRLGSLASEDRDRVLKGSEIFRSLCGSCHGDDGRGLASKVAPPLTSSKRLFADKNTAIRIILHGISGPIDGERYPGDFMPSFGENSDEWIASVLSYARFELRRGPGNNPFPFNTSALFISTEEVTALREKLKSRTLPWTVEELSSEALKDNQ